MHWPLQVKFGQYLKGDFAPLVSTCAADRYNAGLINSSPYQTPTMRGKKFNNDKKKKKTSGEWHLGDAAVLDVPV